MLIVEVMPQDIAFSIVEPMYGNRFEVRAPQSGFVPRNLITALIDDSGANWEVQKTAGDNWVWELKMGTVAKLKSYLETKFTSPAAFRDWILEEKRKYKEKKKATGTASTYNSATGPRKEHHKDCGGVVKHTTARGFHCEKCDRAVPPQEGYWVELSTKTSDRNPGAISDDTHQKAVDWYKDSNLTSIDGEYPGSDNSSATGVANSPPLSYGDGYES